MIIEARLLCRRIPNNWVDTPPSRRWNINPQPLGTGYAEWLPSKEGSMKKGRVRSFTEEKPDKRCSARWSRSTSQWGTMLTACILDTNHADCMYPWHECGMNGTLPLRSSSPKLWPSLNTRKTSRWEVFIKIFLIKKRPNWGTFYKTAQ